MQTKEVDAVCIGAKRYRENDLMLSLLCESGECVTAVCRGARKANGKLKFAAQLFSTASYVLCPSKAGYYIVGGASFGTLSFLSLALSPDAYAYGCLCCEAAALSVQAPAQPMYAALLAALGELTEHEACGDAVTARLLLSGLQCNGYAHASASHGPLVTRLLAAPAGGVSACFDRGEARTLFAGLVSRFCEKIGPLKSLSAVRQLQEAGQDKTDADKKGAE